MTQRWNPNDPNTVGAEYTPLGPDGAVSLAPHNVGVAQKLRFYAATAIDNIAAYVTPQGPGGRLVAEILAGGAEAPAVQQVATLVPVADAGPPALFVSTTGSSTNYWNLVDDPVRTAHTVADGALYNVSAFGGYAYYYARLTAPTLTGRRVAAVRFVWNVALGHQVGDAGWSSAQTMALQLIGPSSQLITLYTLTGVLVQRTVEVMCWNCPWTGLPWTNADVATLNTSTSMGVQVGTGTRNPIAQINAMAAEVIHYGENRLAWAYLRPPAGVVSGAADPFGSWVWGNANAAWSGSSAPGIGSFVNTPASAATGTSWTPSTGTDYTLLIRRLPENDAAAGGIVPFSGAVPFVGGKPAMAGWDAYQPTLDSYGMVQSVDVPWAGIVAGIGTPLPRTYPFVFSRASAPEYGTEANPFSTTTSQQVYGSAYLRASLTPTATGSYQLVKAWVSSDDNKASTRQSLTAQIKRTSDNTTFGSGATITAAQFDALPVGLVISGRKYKLVTFYLSSSASLVGGTSYYVEFTCATAPRAVDGWNVMYLQSYDYLASPAGPVLWEAGYPTGAAIISPASGVHINREALVTIAIAPPAPASATATLLTQAQPDDGTLCQGAWDYVRVTWPAPANTTGFLRWEVERSEDGGTTWYALATTGTATARTVDDYASRRGLPATYRVRQMRSDGGTSVWRQVSASVTPLAHGCRLAFISNATPALNLVFADVGEYTYTFLDATDVELVQAHNRDYQMAFRGEELRGVAMTFDVVLFAAAPTLGVITPVGGHGLPAFDRLRAFQDSDVAEVAMLDVTGNRMFVNVQVLSGGQAAGRWTYVAPVTVTEIADKNTPTVVAFP